MPYADFRAFLDALRANGELIDIDRKVDLHLEVGKALRQTSAVGGPALVHVTWWRQPAGSSTQSPAASARS